MAERSVNNSGNAPQQSLMSKTIAKMMVGAPVVSPSFAARFTAAAMTIMTGRTGSQLDRTTKESRIVALLHCARLGLIPHPVLQHVHIVPFGSEATLIIGYKGRIELARRDADFGVCWAKEVYANDRFEINYGDGSLPTHIPWHVLGASEPGELRGFYACAKAKDGTPLPPEYMTVKEIDAIRARSRAAKAGPWVTDYNMMARKTVLHRAFKVWPQSLEGAYGDALDDTTDTGGSHRKFVRNMAALGDAGIDPDLDALIGEDPAPTDEAVVVDGPAPTQAPPPDAPAAPEPAPEEKPKQAKTISLDDLVKWHAAKHNVTELAAKAELERLCVAVNKRPLTIWAGDPKRFTKWAESLMSADAPSPDNH